jgi:hypothetical protein
MCHGVGDILKPQGDTSSCVGDVTLFIRATTSAGDGHIWATTRAALTQPKRSIRSIPTEV